MPCTNCNSEHIQNKKYNLCGECVFKKSHGGKSKAEVYQERADKKPKKEIKFKGKKILLPTSYTTEKAGITWNSKIVGQVKGIDGMKIGGFPMYFQDEQSQQNEINQNLAELEARREQGKEFNLAEFEINSGRTGFDNHLASLMPKKKKKQKSIRQVSEKQAPIEAAYRLTCIDMDHITEPVCTGCGRYQGGEIRLSHSHIISRADCQRIGKPELIYERLNLTYHCMTFSNNVGCHNKWESPVERITLLDYKKNIEYIKSVSPEMYLKYSVDA